MPADIHIFTQRAMGTLFQVRVEHADRRYAAGAAQAVFARIEEIERALTRYDAASDLCRVNRAPLGEWITVAPDLHSCLQQAQSVFRETDGRFDPSYRAPGGFAALELDFTTLPQVRARLPLDLDMGGIGKGYALDQAADLLREWDLPRAVLHGGGSTVLAMDPPSHGGGWRVGAGEGVSLTLARDSLSASGTAVKGAHIVNTRTGIAAQGPLRVWARAREGWRSDALATAFFAMTPDEIRAYCAKHVNVSAQWIGGTDSTTHTLHCTIK